MHGESALGMKMIMFHNDTRAKGQELTLYIELIDACCYMQLYAPAASICFSLCQAGPCRVEVQFGSFTHKMAVLGSSQKFRNHVAYEESLLCDGARALHHDLFRTPEFFL